MTIKNIFILLICFNIYSASASSSPDIHKKNWKGLDIVWLETDSPLYNFHIRFYDGSLSDGDMKGSTNAALALLSSGTPTMSREEIVDKLEFLGTSFGADVTSLYSDVKISGLVKDAGESMNLICNLFQNANFPSKMVELEKNRTIENIKNITRNPSSLASLVFRELSLQGSGLEYPSEGKLADIVKLNPKALKKQLSYLNQKVKKRIYISGPKKILELEKIVTKKCGWNLKASFVRKVVLPKKVNSGKSYLVTIPNSNQAQIRQGRVLTPSDLTNPYALDLANNFLGGGFSSLLMQEVRVKRGLTYSIGSMAASADRAYGRLMVVTSSKNPTAIRTLRVIERSIERLKRGKIETESFLRSKGQLMGSQPFKFEQSSALIDALANLDQRGLDYDFLFKYTDNISPLKKESISDQMKKLFDWSKMTTVVVGSKKIEQEMRKMFKNLKVVDYKEFL